MTATTTTSTPGQAFLIDFSHRWLDAWNRRDGEALGELCTEDVRFYDPAIGEIHGRAAVAGWVATCQRAFPDYVFEEPEPGLLSPDGSKAIVPWRMRGTNTGPLDPPGFAPTNRPMTMEGVDHWWFRDGLVARYRADYDLLGVMRQLGILPEKGSREEQAMVRLQRLRTRLRRR
jgi:steroid delta-isomerase-like uncharacterized protein